MPVQFSKLTFVDKHFQIQPLSLSETLLHLSKLVFSVLNMLLLKDQFLIDLLIDVCLLEKKILRCENIRGFNSVIIKAKVAGD